MGFDSDWDFMLSRKFHIYIMQESIELLSKSTHNQRDLGTPSKILLLISDRVCLAAE